VFLGNVIVFGINSRISHPCISKRVYSADLLFVGVQPASLVIRARYTSRLVRARAGSFEVLFGVWIYRFGCDNLEHGPKLLPDRRSPFRELLLWTRAMAVDGINAIQRDVAALPALPYEPAPAFQINRLQDDSTLADCKGLRIGVLIVTYNAVTTIPKVLKRITPNVWNNVEEVVIFDDASPDPTYELAMGIKTLSNIPKLNVLKHPKNLGYGGNQKAGYQYFIDRGFDIVVLLHGDGQYAPEILAHMYQPLVNGQADAVFGSRMMKTYGGPLKGGMPFYKYVGNRILTVFENWTLGLNLTEFHSGYRAYNLHALKRIDFSQMTDDFHFDTEIIIKLHHQGLRISEIPIPTYYGDEICYVNGLKYAQDVFRAVYRYKQTKRSVAKFPEYEEYFVHYPVKHSSWSSHQFARQAVVPLDEVLDLGCGRGVLAAEMVERGCRVVGADVIPAAQVEPVLERYIQTDLMGQGIAEVLDQLGDRKFDKILLLDIIEHLADPAALVSECRKLLRPGGHLVVSVPNVANISVRLLLLLGKFDYMERGILDRTHLRFFTRRTIRQLLEAAGYTVVSHKMTVISLEVIVSLSLRNPLMRLGHGLLILLTRLMPGLFGYQSFITVRAKNKD
jgi:2-polyprenyl-3-methyl-5-hydroxy-6-metoxy-1,4-benzoquinol methylase